jgi:hypothetical protein
MADQYHEPFDLLSNEAKNITRAIKSLKEELEAVDWYNQRADIATDPELKSILEHNRSEEIEHAVMLLEWLRRNMKGWDEELKTYLFTSASITSLEEEEDSETQEKVKTSGKSLNIGDLK